MIAKGKCYRCGRKLTIFAYSPKSNPGKQPEQCSSCRATASGSMRRYNERKRIERLILERTTG